MVTLMIISCTKSFEAKEEHVVLVNDVPKCFQEINQWMKAHYLQLNPGKTEILVFGTPSVLHELTIKGVFINSETCVRLSPVAKNLGFRLDSQLSFKGPDQATKIVLLLETERPCKNEKLPYNKANEHTCPSSDHLLLGLLQQPLLRMQQCGDDSTTEHSEQSLSLGVWPEEKKILYKTSSRNFIGSKFEKESNSSYVC